MNQSKLHYWRSPHPQLMSGQEGLTATNLSHGATQMLILFLGLWMMSFLLIFSVLMGSLLTMPEEIVSCVNLQSIQMIQLIQMYPGVQIATLRRRYRGGGRRGSDCVTKLLPTTIILHVCRHCIRQYLSSLCKYISVYTQTSFRIEFFTTVVQSS